MNRFGKLKHAFTALVLTAATVGAGSKAEDEPHVLPMQDADITYQVTRPGQPAAVERRRWSASERLQRVDGPKGTTIFNRQREEITLLNPANKTYRILEGSPRMPMATGKGVKLQRGANATVANHHCVDWSWRDDTERHTACLPPDGVMLRLIIDGQTILEARSVKYAQQPPNLFDVPKGYSPAFSPEGGPVP
jgi:hypothetical protein